jgi:hypothetical protein
MNGHFVSVDMRLLRDGLESASAHSARVDCVQGTGFSNAHDIISMPVGKLAR